MANLILASKREVKSGSQMWHVYRLSENTKSDEFFFAQPIKALRYCFLLRKRSGAILPKAIYTKLMADVEASKAQAEQAAPQEQSAAPEAEQAAEQSALAKAFEQMKAKHHPHKRKGHHRPTSRFSCRKPRHIPAQDCESRQASSNLR